MSKHTYPGQKKIAPPNPPKYLVNGRNEVIKIASNNTRDRILEQQGAPAKFTAPDPLSRPLIDTKTSMLNSEEKKQGPAHR
jgi:hypothetical protein